MRKQAVKERLLRDADLTLTTSISFYRADHQSAHGLSMMKTDDNEINTINRYQVPNRFTSHQ